MIKKKTLTLTLTDIQVVIIYSHLISLVCSNSLESRGDERSKKCVHTFDWSSIFTLSTTSEQL